MKKTLILLLALTMVLCACSKEKKDTPTVTQSQSQTSSTQTSPEPEVVPQIPYEQFYIANSAVETATEGAVKEYDVGDCYGIKLFGDGLLLFSGEDESKLTCINSNGIQAEIEMKDQFLYPVDVTILPEDKLAYYDTQQSAVVVLDSSLQETNRFALPDVEGPVINGDGSRIYYLTSEELRYLDVSSGTDKLLKEISFSTQMLQKLHFDDSLLECCVSDEDYIQTLLIDTKTGQLVAAMEYMPIMETFGDNYFAVSYEEGFAQNLFGTRDGTPSCLIAEGDVDVESIQKQSVVSCGESEDTISLYYYDLSSGTKTSEVELPIAYIPYAMATDTDSGEIWFLSENMDYESRLYCWNPTLTETEDTTSCVTPYYTSENPDEEGLEQIAEKAKELSQKYGVRVRVYEEALSVEPSDYTFELAYHVPLYQQYLAELETALAQYPEGFLKKVGTTSGNGKITISLVGAAYGNNDLGSLNTADGVHFYNDGNVYIALVMKERFAATLYHEMFHSIDTYVLNQCTAFDDWDKLNPKGFKYDNDYVANQMREDYQYLEEDRWFIDMYSMSYPKEDRARIMEYAMESGNEEYFESKNMQKKLSALCKGIRTAFGLKKSATLPWEQYLG